MNFSHEPRKRAGGALFWTMAAGTVLMGSAAFFDPRGWAMLPPLLLFALLGLWMWRAY